MQSQTVRFTGDIELFFDPESPEYKKSLEIWENHSVKERNPDAHFLEYVACFISIGLPNHPRSLPIPDIGYVHFMDDDLNDDQLPWSGIKVKKNFSGSFSCQIIQTRQYI